MTEQVYRQVAFSGTVHGLWYQPIIIKGTLVDIQWCGVNDDSTGETIFVLTSDGLVYKQQDNRWINMQKDLGLFGSQMQGSKRVNFNFKHFEQSTWLFSEI